MVAEINTIRAHRLTWAVGVSFLLHLIFLLLFTQWEEIGLFPLLREEKQIAFEIVENPNSEHLKEKPEEADLISDRNSAARDRANQHRQNAQLPYSEGISQVKDLRVKQSAAESEPSRQSGMQKNRQNIENGNQLAETEMPVQSSRSFSRDQLLKGGGAHASDAQNLAYRQIRSGVDNQGGISFNTYDWDFAPYLLKLKKRIERNIYPPPAFTHLGIGGNNVIRFRIARNGKMVGSDILGYEGEKALIETSKRAVEVSAPFWPLPDDFPQDYLEVTARFYYVVNESS